MVDKSQAEGKIEFNFKNDPKTRFIIERSLIQLMCKKEGIPFDRYMLFLIDFFDNTSLEDKTINTDYSAPMLKLDSLKDFRRTFLEDNTASCKSLHRSNLEVTFYINIETHSFTIEETLRKFMLMRGPENFWEIDFAPDEEPKVWFFQEAIIKKIEEKTLTFNVNKFYICC